MRRHGIEEGDRAADVVVVVKDWLLDRLAHRLEAGEVHHRMELVRRKHAVERLALAKVHAMELDLLACELAQSLENRSFRIDQVIHDDQVVPRLRERDTGVGADVAEPAGDKEDLPLQAGTASLSLRSGMCRSQRSTSAGSAKSVASSARASSSVWSTDSTTLHLRPLRSVAISRRVPNGSRKYADQKRPPSGTGPMTFRPQLFTCSTMASNRSGGTWKATC